MHDSKVLIIEDSSELAVLYRKILAPLKCQIVCVETGSAAMQYLAETRPHVIITDLTLPDMTTEQFFEKFISVDGIDAVPLILISGREDLQSWQDLFGAAHALKKPTDVIRFRECVKSLLPACTPRPLEV